MSFFKKLFATAVFCVFMQHICLFTGAANENELDTKTDEDYTVEGEVAHSYSVSVESSGSTDVKKKRNRNIAMLGLFGLISIVVGISIFGGAFKKPQLIPAPKALPMAKTIKAEVTTTNNTIKIFAVVMAIVVIAVIAMMMIPKQSIFPTATAPTTATELAKLAAEADTALAATLGGLPKDSLSNVDLHDQAQLTATIAKAQADGLLSATQADELAKKTAEILSSFKLKTDALTQAAAAAAADAQAAAAAPAAEGTATKEATTTEATKTPAGTTPAGTTPAAEQTWYQYLEEKWEIFCEFYQNNKVAWDKAADDLINNP